ncbi:MAG: hypothetical protein DVB23_003095 [Verrucomicrobia bacterium]|jgi:hypothetical protein|nr:MAG: hypothetical protein DVB23_003095 [Verrucomicrobiota bacterium]
MSHDPCLSIDFGNAFTKVAVRPAASAATIPVSHPDLQFDRGLNVCIPTMAVKVGTGGIARWYFGADAMDVPYNRAGCHFFLDWKHDFFQPAERNTEGVVIGSASQVTHSGQARNSSISPDELDRVARGFFDWLRLFLDDRLAEKGLPSVRDCVTRIAIPAFAIDSEPEGRLLAILGEAGFRTAYSQPTLPEPLANAIGIFTNGRNDTGEALEPDQSVLFEGTRMVEAMRGRALHRSGPLTFWTLAADLGAYTLDMAVIGFSTSDPSRSLMDTYYGKERFALCSEPLGVSGLTQRIRSVLEPTNRSSFDAILRGSDPAELHLLQDNLFHWRRPFLPRGATQAIGEGREGERIHREVDQFAEEAGMILRHFLKRYQYNRIDEVVLTGGGMYLPAVRDSVFRAAERLGATHAYVPARAGDPPAHHVYTPLSGLQTRAGTATGGASVFFDLAPEILNR